MTKLDSHLPKPYPAWLVTVHYVNGIQRFITVADTAQQAKRIVQDKAPTCSPSLSVEPLIVAMERGAIPACIQVLP